MVFRVAPNPKLKLGENENLSFCERLEETKIGPVVTLTIDLNTSLYKAIEIAADYELITAETTSSYKSAT